MAKNSKHRKLDNEVRKRKSNNILLGGGASEPDDQQEPSEEPDKMEASLSNLSSLEEVRRLVPSLRTSERVLC